jgi:serine/threonine-protein kinase PknK
MQDGLARVPTLGVRATTRLGTLRRARAAPVAVAVAVAVAGLALGACGAPTRPASAPSPQASSDRAARTGSELVAAVAPFTLPAAISRAVVVALPDGDLLVAGGLDAADQSVGGVFRLDPETGALRGLGALPMPTHDAGGALLDGQLVVLGGGTTESTASVQAFPLAPGAEGGRVVGELPTARSDLATATVGRTVYVVGGFDGTRALRSVLATRDGRSFRVAARLRQAVRYPAVAVLGHRLIVLGGASARGSPLATVQLVDLRTGATRVLGALPAPLADAAAVVLDGEVLLAGGFTASGAPSGEILRFDPATARTTVVGTLPVPVGAAGSAVVGTTAYLVGGEDPASVAAVQELRLLGPEGRAHERPASR